MAGGKRVVGGAVSLVLAGGLVVYGAQAWAVLQGAGAPIAGIVGDPSARQGVVLSAGRPAPKTDLEVAQTLGLTKQQMARFVKLDREKTARNAELRSMKSGHFEYGAKINTWWNTSLKSIFTKDQYRRYCGAWSSGGGGYAATAYSPARAVPGGQQGAAVAGASGAANPAEAAFGGQEERILASLNLNAEQWQRVRELYAKLGNETQELRELWKGDDPDAVGWKSSAINKMQREGMKAILTPEQHQKYQQAWYEVMKPYFATGEKATRRARMIVGGKASSASFAPLTEEQARALLRGK